MAPDILSRIGIRGNILARQSFDQTYQVFTMTRIDPSERGQQALFVGIAREDLFDQHRLSLFVRQRRQSATGRNPFECHAVREVAVHLHDLLKAVQ
ncbi:MAG: hypothetical protein KF811_03975 [Dokdonella sp.]|nr:hypothetical protein [Dokdonella sp.]